MPGDDQLVLQYASWAKALQQLNERNILEESLYASRGKMSMLKSNHLPHSSWCNVQALSGNRMLAVHHPSCYISAVHFNVLSFCVNSICTFVLGLKLFQSHKRQERVHSPVWKHLRNIRL